MLKGPLRECCAQQAEVVFYRYTVYHINMTCVNIIHEEHNYALKPLSGDGGSAVPLLLCANVSRGQVDLNSHSVEEKDLGVSWLDADRPGENLASEALSGDSGSAVPLLLCANVSRGSVGLNSHAVEEKDLGLSWLDADCPGEKLASEATFVVEEEKHFARFDANFILPRPSVIYSISKLLCLELQ
jgi:hypothetical protein